MLHGILPSIAAVGGHYDPSWSSVTDNDDDHFFVVDRLLKLAGNDSLANYWCTV